MKRDEDLNEEEFELFLGRSSFSESESTNEIDFDDERLREFDQDDED